MNNFISENNTFIISDVWWRGLVIVKLTQYTMHRDFWHSIVWPPFYRNTACTWGVHPDPY